MHVDEPGWLRIEMTALAIHPLTIQYIAVGFSNDRKMGDDAVSECILSDRLGVVEAEVFVSHNVGTSNSRIDLTTDQHNKLIKDVGGDVIDGRLICRFSQRIMPLIEHRQIWPLNNAYYLLAATGKAQPDEVNVHDTNVHSHYYPIVSNDKIDPSSLGRAANEIDDLTHNNTTTIVDVNDVIVESTKITPNNRRTNAATTIQLIPLLLLLPLILL